MNDALASHVERHVPFLRRPGPLLLAMLLLAGGFLAAPADAPAAPSPVPAHSPAPTQTPLKTDIYSITPASVNAHSGDHFEGIVRTSPDVVSVTANMLFFHRTLERASTGEFKLFVDIPARGIPWFFHRRNYTITVQARSARGVTVERRVPVYFS